ncbi:ATP-dependent helicase [Paenibacillus elgii]|uniref:ATP-dependent helicase n=1 Tax=Paenibacillus elgii TaxID=189691 RepID=UPI002D7C4A1A|nr:ATP-dependent helicase [Paenibacillus elgii]
MDIHQIFNKITGKDKLIYESENLKTNIYELKEEKKTLLATLSTTQSNYEKLSGNALKLKKAYESLEDKYRELADEYKQKSEALTELEEEHYYLNEHNNNLIEFTDELKETIEGLEEDKNQCAKALEQYQTRYGMLSQFIRSSDNGVSASDTDATFFEEIEKIKGNPFNNNQVEAIRYDMKKHLQIIAGAGSGKTETICAKVAYLIQMRNVDPKRICMVTFTRKAADEMKERVNQFLGTESDVNVNTFHGMFMGLFNNLEKQSELYRSIGVQGDDPKEGENLYKEELNKLISQFKLHKFNKLNDKSIFERIGYWINMGYSTEDMVRFVEKHFDSTEEKPDQSISLRFSLLMEHLYDIRKSNNIVVYDDFLQNLYTALNEYESAREYVRNRFDYIFIDEFQDINPLQMETIQLICPPYNASAKLIIVGDDDQSIYAFRGSNPNYIKDFSQTYDTKDLKLMTNYRSKSNIVAAGNAVIIENKDDRIPKSMDAFQSEHGHAVIVAAPDELKEAHWILSRVEEIAENEIPFEIDGRVDKNNYTSSVVLYRAKGQLQSMYQALDARGIPYVIEKLDDVMGIFSIRYFHGAFKLWVELLNSEGNKRSHWMQIFNNLFSCFFISKNTSEKWIASINYKNKDMTELINEAIKFIKVEQPKKDKEINAAIQYLKLLLDLKQKKDVNLKKFIEQYLELPKIKQNINDEEKEWIVKEIEQFKIWAELYGFYERMEERKAKMKENLEKYHKGEYNALYFLTIHRSKGLAFKNVFVIGVYDGGLPSSRAVKLEDVDLEECREKAEPPTTVEEERRLMYVAVTRAKKNVYVTFPKKVMNRIANRSVFLKELNLEIIDADKFEKWAKPQNIISI